MIRTIPDDKDLKDRIMQALRVKPHTSEELAGQLGTSDRTIRRRLEHLPVIAKMDKGRKLYSPIGGTRPPDGPVVVDPKSLIISSKAIPPPGQIRTPKRTSKMPESGHPFSACVLAVLKADPDHTFHVRDVAEKTRGKLDTVNRTLSRFSKTGKGSGPVRKVSHGFYKYDPAKEPGNLMDFTGSGNWKIENLVFVRMEARSLSGQSQNTGSDDQNQAYPPDKSGQETGAIRTQSDTRIPIPKTGYPITLPTGQQVSWEQHDNNGTEIIRISANGAPPLSPDSAILLIDHLGIDDTWKCVSLELNVDSYKHRIDSSYSLQVVKGLLLKAYQHGYNTRVEIADRREVPVREVMDLFHTIAGGIDGKEALRKTESLEARLKQNEKDIRLSLNIGRKALENTHQSKCTGKASKKQKPPATFTPASALRQQPAPAPASQRAGP